MRDVTRAEGEVAGAGLDDVVADVDRDIALEDVEALVLVVVDVQRRLGVRRLCHLDDRELSVRVGGARLDDREGVEPPAGVLGERCVGHGMASWVLGLSRAMA